MIRPFPTDSDIEALVIAFFDTSLPRADWTHPAHLAVGLHLVRSRPFDDALAEMRTGIHAYLGRHGTTGVGYSETITRFYLHLIAAWNRAHPGSGSIADDVAHLVEDLGHPNLPARWYSPGRLSSAAAAAAWVEPDLQLLPPLTRAAPSVA